MSKHFKLFIFFLVLFVVVIVHINGAKIVSVREMFVRNDNDVYKTLYDMTFEDDMVLERLPEQYQMIRKVFDKSAYQYEYNKSHVALLSIEELSRKVNQLEFETEQIQKKLEHVLALSGHQLKTYRIGMEDSDVSVTNIQSSFKRQNVNFGRSLFNCIGLDNEGVSINRLLVSFNQFPNFPSNAVIVSAKIKFIVGGDWADGQYILNENIVMFPLRMSWEEGEGDGHEEDVERGVSWRYRNMGQEPWHTPGLWPDEQDVELQRIAEYRGLSIRNAHTEVALDFNEYGIKWLQEIISGSRPNVGALIKLDYEQRTGTKMCFYGDEIYEEHNKRPILEIEYVMPAQDPAETQ